MPERRMRHRRGIDIDRTAPVREFTNADEFNWWTFGDLREWFMLGGRCVKCGRRGTLDRWELERRWGKNVMIMSLSHRLRCTVCENRKGNRFWFAAMKR